MNRPRIPSILLPLGLAGLLVAVAACAEPESGSSGGAALPSTAELTEEQKVFYFLGTLTGRSLDQFSLSDEEMAVVQRSLDDYRAGETLELDGEVYGKRLQAIMGERRMAAAQEEKSASQAFLDAQAARPGVRKLDSGILVESLSAGSGDKPPAGSTVRVHYHGTLRDGKVFDSSRERGQPFETALARVVPCWQQGITELQVGEKAKLYCPSDLAYGDRGSPPTIPGGAALVFEVELLEIVQ